MGRDKNEPTAHWNQNQFYILHRWERFSIALTTVLKKFVQDNKYSRFHVTPQIKSHGKRAVDLGGHSISCCNATK